MGGSQSVKRRARHQCVLDVTLWFLSFTRSLLPWWETLSILRVQFPLSESTSTGLLETLRREFPENLLQQLIGHCCNVQVIFLLGHCCPKLIRLWFARKRTFYMRSWLHHGDTGLFLMTTEEEESVCVVAGDCCGSRTRWHKSDGTGVSPSR